MILFIVNNFLKKTLNFNQSFEFVVNFKQKKIQE